MALESQRTLKKARFFVRQAELAETRLDRVACSYYLEAAIESGRSVALHLHRELHRSPRFPEWWERRLAEMKSDPAMTFCHETRIYIVHKGSTPIRQLTALSVGEAVALSDTFRVRVVRAKPWYQRSPKVTAEDVRRRVAASFQQCREKVLIGWRRARSRLRPRPSQPTIVTQFLYFEDWSGERRPASEQVREYLDKLELIVDAAAEKFKDQPRVAT